MRFSEGTQKRTGTYAGTGCGRTVCVGKDRFPLGDRRHDPRPGDAAEAEYYKVDIRDLIEGERKTPGENAEAGQSESLHAAARYAREKEKRTVFRLAMVFLGILVLIIGINALLRAGQREKRLNDTETRRFYGKVISVRQGLYGQTELVLDCDTFEAHIRMEPETRLDDSLKERILAHTEDLYLIVLCEYPARERYDAEKRQGIYVYPAYHITEWQKN